MSPGQADYELRKQQKKDLKMDADRILAKRQAREAKADEVVDLVLDALKALLTGQAEICVEDVSDTQRRVSFLPTPSA